MCCGPGTLTSSASLVMGYFSRLEMTSNTATMFRICKTRAASHVPALLPIPVRSASPSPRASGASNTKAPTPHSLPPAPGANMAPSAHPPIHVHTTSPRGCHTIETHDSYETRSAPDPGDRRHTLLCHLMGWEADAFIK